MEITEQGTKVDFAHQMRWLAKEAHPEPGVIRVVLDNLNTHRQASLYEAFPAEEARRIARRLEFHHTPKHGSWLNPVLSLSKGWQRSSSASYPAAASDRGNRTRTVSAGRHMPWSRNATRPRRSSTGASPPRTLGPNSIASIPYSQRD